MSNPTRVLKYRLPFLAGLTDVVDIELPVEAALLHVAVQAGEIHLWAAVADPAQTRTERFRMYGTGHPIDGAPRYLGTVHHNGLVWHVFHEPNVTGSNDVLAGAGQEPARG